VLRCCGASAIPQEFQGIISELCTRNPSVGLEASSSVQSIMQRIAKINQKIEKPEGSSNNLLHVV
jgi:hypothetical protein